MTQLSRRGSNYSADFDTTTRRLRASKAARAKRSRRQAALEQLEPRTLLSYTFSLAGATGTAQGDASVDSIVIDQVGGFLEHSVNGGAFDFDWDSATPGVQTLAASPASTVNVNMSTGNGSSVQLGTITNQASTLLAKFNLNPPSGNTADTLLIDDRSNTLVSTYDYDGFPGHITGVLNAINIQQGTFPFGGGATIEGGSAGNTFNVISTFSFGGIGEPLKLVGGAGADTANVKGATAVGVPVSIDMGGSSSNQVNVTNGAGLVVVNGPVTVKDTGGFSSLVVDNSADATHHDVSIADAGVNNVAITGLSPAAINYQPSGLVNVTVDSGSGGDNYTYNVTEGDIVNTRLNTNNGGGPGTVNVLATGSTDTVTVSSGVLGEDVNVGNAGSVQGIHGHLIVQNPLSFTNLVVDDSADTTARTFSILQNGSNVDITGLAPAVITFAGGDLLSLAIDAGSGGNTIDYNVGFMNADFTTTLDTGAGADTTTIEATSPVDPLIVQGNDGQDSVSVGGSAHTMQNIQGDVTIRNAGEFTDVTLDDASDTTGRTMEMNNNGTDTTVTGLSPATITMHDTDISSVVVNGGSGGNTFNVHDTLNNIFRANVPTTINMGTGADTANVTGTHTGSTLNVVGQNNGDVVNVGLGNTSNIHGEVHVTNPPTFTTLNVDDSADSSGKTVTISDTQITGIAPAVISYASNDIDPLNISGGSGGNSFHITALPTFSTANLHTGTGTNSVTVDATGPFNVLNVDDQGSDTVKLTNMENIVGPVHISGSAGSSTAITFDDTANSGGRNATLNTAAGVTTLGGFSPADVTYVPAAANSVSLLAGSGNDQLTIDFSGGNPIPVGANGIEFNGGAGSNKLVLQSGTFTNEIYDAFGPGSGNIDFDGFNVHFDNLRPIDDTVAVTNFTFNAPFGAQGVSIANGPIVNGVQTATISSEDTPPGFELINIGNKTNVTVNATSAVGDQQVDINLSTPSAGMANLTVNTGPGNDQINLTQTPTNVNTVANAGSGNDTFNVVAEGLGSGGTDSVNGGTGIDTINLDATGTEKIDVSVPGVIQIDPADPTDPNLFYSNIEIININNLPDQPLTPIPVPINATEGAQIVNAVVAKFQDATPPLSKATDFVASIDWGDGSPITAGIIVQEGPADPVTGLITYDVLGTHTFSNDALVSPFTVTTTVTDLGSSSTTTVGGVKITFSDSGGSTTTVTSSADVVQSPLLPEPATVTATEGLAIPIGTIVASFVDTGGADPVGSYTATINWGDGSPVETALVVANGVNFTVQNNLIGGHIYTEEGVFPLTVTITDAAGPGSAATTAFATGSVVVKDAALNGTSGAVITTAVEGQPLTDVQVASFTDGNPTAPISDFTATIDWGDGSGLSFGTITQPGGAGSPFIVSGTHTYAEETTTGHTIHVLIQDEGGSQTQVNTLVTQVADAPFTVDGTDVSGQEGKQLVNVPVATITDSNPGGTLSDFTATIDWGDGTTTTGVIAAVGGGSPSGVAFQVLGTHTYEEEGSFTIHTTVTDVGSPGSPESDNSAALINDAPLTPVSASPIVATEGVAQTGILVATFTDQNPGADVGDFTGTTIDWGDGSPLDTTVTITALGGGVFSVTDDHTFNEEGNFQVKVHIVDVGGSTTVVNTAAIVADVPPVATPRNFTVTEGDVFNGVVANFTEIHGTNLEDAGDFTATIDWGDGSPATEGIIGTIPGGFTVSGRHTYADSEVNAGAGVLAGHFPVTVTIHDDGGTFTRVTSDATVNDRPIVGIPPGTTVPPGGFALTGVLNPLSDTGMSHFDAITNNAQPNFFGASEPGSIITLSAAPTSGSGLFILGTTVADASGFWSFNSPHLADGSYTILASAIDASHHTTSNPNLQILPNAGQGPLVIDTVGPKVTALNFNRLAGQLTVTFQDDRSGMDQASVIDGSNYLFQKAHSGPGSFLVTGINPLLPLTPTDTEPTTLSINNGRSLRGGHYSITIFSASVLRPSGIQDVAGNGLDGEFFGFFPSGNNIPGGNFVALINAVHNIIFSPAPVQSTATPVFPPGTRQGDVFIPTVVPGTPINQATLHDIALASVASTPRRRHH